MTARKKHGGGGFVGSGGLGEGFGVASSSPVVYSGYESLNVLLSSLGVEKYSSLFVDQEIDLDTPKMMGENDLSEIGMPKGPRLKILRAVAGDIASSNYSNDAKLAAQLAERDAEMAAQAAEMASLKQQLAGNTTSSNNSTIADASPSDNSECVICLDAKPTRLLFPCKHLCLCNRCWVSRYSSNVSVCPFCRGKVESTIEIFPA